MSWISLENNGDHLLPNGQILEFRAFQGEYHSGATYSETIVSSSGGGGVLGAGGGYVRAPVVRSKSIENREFFLKSGEDERAYHLQNARLVARDGHIVTVSVVSSKGGGREYCVFAKNHNTGDCVAVSRPRDYQPIFKYNNVEGVLTLAAGFLGLGALLWWSTPLGVLLLVGCGYGVFRNHRLTQELHKSFAAKVREIERAADRSFGCGAGSSLR